MLKLITQPSTQLLLRAVSFAGELLYALLVDRMHEQPSSITERLLQKKPIVGCIGYPGELLDTFFHKEADMSNEELLKFLTDSPVNDYTLFVVINESSHALLVADTNKSTQVKSEMFQMNMDREVSVLSCVCVDID